jgi:AGCS family alanine or glycine:cation symporter
MYYIEKGLGEKFKPLAMMFSISGLFGCTIFFQSNQLSQIIREYLYKPIGIFQDQIFTGDLVTGCMVAALVGTVIFGGIKRIAKVASTMVPIMVGIYLLAAIIIIGKNIHFVPNIFSLIIQDAFSGSAVAGGAVGSMISIGVRRGLFSNEAGTGTETMAHGAAKTKEPVREGLVAMLGPFIDTIIVCSITAIVILLSGVYTQDLNGVSMTVSAFEHELGTLGKIVIMVAVLTFSLSTMFGYSYYGRKCTSYLFGTKWKIVYNWFYIMMIVLASTISIDIAINFMDSAFALMVIPTIISTILLAPKVLSESKRYFNQI